MFELKEVERRAKLLGWYFERFSRNIFLLRDKKIDNAWTFSGLIDDDHKSEKSQRSKRGAMDLIFREEEYRSHEI